MSNEPFSETEKSVNISEICGNEKTNHRLVQKKSEKGCEPRAMSNESFLESENLKTSESEKSCEPRAMSNEPFLESENLKTSEPEKVLESENLKISEPENVSESENLKTSEPENVLESHHYFIVGGSFQTLDRAEFCLKDIRSQGFENASLLEKNDKGYIRVYYESFVEKSDALIRLDVIKNDFNESAWLLFQK